MGTFLTLFFAVWRACGSDSWIDPVAMVWSLGSDAVLPSLTYTLSRCSLVLWSECTLGALSEHLCTLGKAVDQLVVYSPEARWTMADFGRWLTECESDMYRDDQETILLPNEGALKVTAMVAEGVERIKATVFETFQGCQDVTWRLEPGPTELATLLGESILSLRPAVSNLRSESSGWR